MMFKLNTQIYPSGLTLGLEEEGVWPEIESAKPEVESKNCSSITLQLLDPKTIGSLMPLGVICLVVTFGNILVISAVRISSKLRGATNLLIVSLAVADLLLGVLILPMSAVYEVIDVWILGSQLCFIWLSVDVLTSTASILHLVVISLDRYIAVTHPVTYPNIMTTKRAKLMICGVWVISFIICFPPLVGWNTSGADSIGFKDNGDCSPKCTLSSDPGYVIYSAVGSFFAPMLVMMFFNWRIYRTAKKTTKAIRQGFTRVKNGGADIGGMGIHRGKFTARQADAREDKNYIELTKFSLTEKAPRRTKRDSLASVNGQFLGHPQTSLSALTCETNFMGPRTRSGRSIHTKLFSRRSKHQFAEVNGNGVSVRTRRTCSHKRRSFSDQGTQTNTSFISRKRGRRKRGFLNLSGYRASLFKPANSGRPGKVTYSLRGIRQDSKEDSEPPSPTNSILVEEGMAGARVGSNKAFAKRNIKNQVRKFRMETKAAKTIGIIVGCFVLCWLPFFTIYIGRVFCSDCVPELLFSIFFWLGYCNSAINPFIYALFARDFRNAFKKILCKIFCKKIS